MNNQKLVSGCLLAGAILAGMQTAGASQLLPNYTEFGGGPNAGVSSGLMGPVPDATQGGSYFYGDTITSAVGGPSIGTTGNGFYEDYVFSVAAGQVDDFTSTISLSNISGVSGLEVRLFNASGNASLPVLGAPVGGAIDAWSTSNTAAGYTTDVIPTTQVAAGTYVLEVRGSVSGAANGSYSGVLNVTPVPLPLALPMLMSALGGLGLVTRRRRCTTD